MLVAVTGASGFLGRMVVSELVQRGADVLAISRSKCQLPPSAKGLTVADYTTVPISENMVVVHLAEPRDTSVLETGGGYQARNVKVVDALLAHHPRRLVYASSAVVYGDAVTSKRRPEEKPDPNGIYACSKIACENRVIEARGVVARLSNVYGPGMAGHSVLGDILAQIRGEKPLVIRDGRPVCDFLWIEDAARGLADMALGDGGGVFNLGTGEGTSVAHLARTTLDLAGQPNRPVIEKQPANRTSTIVLDPKKTTATFGWKAQVPLAAGLARLLTASSS